MAPQSCVGQGCSTMNLFLALAQAASFFDAWAVLSFTGLLGSLGAAAWPSPSLAGLSALLRHKAEAAEPIHRRIQGFSQRVAENIPGPVGPAVRSPSGIASTNFNATSPDDTART